MKRYIKCMSKGGVVFIRYEVEEKLIKKLRRKEEERKKCIKYVEMG